MNKVGEIYNKIKTDGFWNSLVTNSFWAFFGDSTASLINLAITIFLIKLIGNDNYGYADYIFYKLISEAVWKLKHLNLCISFLHLTWFRKINIKIYDISKFRDLVAVC